MSAPYIPRPLGMDIVPQTADFGCSVSGASALASLNKSDPKPKGETSRLLRYFTIAIQLPAPSSGYRKTSRFRSSALKARRRARSGTRRSPWVPAAPWGAGALRTAGCRGHCGELRSGGAELRYSAAAGESSGGRRGTSPRAPAGLARRSLPIGVSCPLVRIWSARGRELSQ